MILCFSSDESLKKKNHLGFRGQALSSIRQYNGPLNVTDKSIAQKDTFKFASTAFLHTLETTGASKINGCADVTVAIHVTCPPFVIGRTIRENELAQFGMILKGKEYKIPAVSSAGHVDRDCIRH